MKTCSPCQIQMIQSSRSMRLSKLLDIAAWEDERSTKSSGMGMTQKSTPTSPATELPAYFIRHCWTTRRQQRKTRPERLINGMSGQNRQTKGISIQHVYNFPSEAWDFGNPPKWFGQSFWFDPRPSSNTVNQVIQPLSLPKIGDPNGWVRLHRN